MAIIFASSRLDNSSITIENFRQSSRYTFAVHFGISPIGDKASWERAAGWVVMCDGRNGIDRNETEIK